MHGDVIQQARLGVRLEADQDVDVAVRAEILAQHRTEQRQLRQKASIPAPGTVRFSDNNGSPPGWKVAAPDRLLINCSSRHSGLPVGATPSRPDVWEVLEPYITAGHDWQTLRDSYPDLDEGLLLTALRYYEAYPDEIEARIRLNLAG